MTEPECEGRHHPRRRQVVTAFLRHAGRVLLVRRSAEVGTYRGRWSAISGYLESTPLAQAYTEIAEETGLGREDVRLRAHAPPLEVFDEALGTLWAVHPFLFDVLNPEAIRLDWENTQMEWVAPADLERYETVPALAEALARCLRAADAKLGLGGRDGPRGKTGGG